MPSDTDPTVADSEQLVEREIDRYLEPFGFEQREQEHEQTPTPDAELGDRATELLERLEATRRRVEVASNPDVVATLETGAPDEGYHPYESWGPIVRVDEPLQWRSAVIDAEQPGSATLLVYEIEYEQGATYEPGELVAAREITAQGGPERVPIEVTLEPGHYFVTRTDDPVPMRRVAVDVDWDELDDPDLPLRLECSWQLGRKPGTEAFDRYIERGWDRVLHYFGDLEIGHLDTEAAE